MINNSIKTIKKKIQQIYNNNDKRVKVVILFY